MELKQRTEPAVRPQAALQFEIRDPLDLAIVRAQRPAQFRQRDLKREQEPS